MARTSTSTSTPAVTPATIKVAPQREALCAQHSAALRVLEKRGYKGSSRDLGKRGLRLAAQASWWPMPEAAEYAALRVVTLAEGCGLTWSARSWSERCYVSFYRDGRKIASMILFSDSYRWNGDDYRYEYPHFSQVDAWEKIFHWLVREDEIQCHIKNHILIDQDMIFEILGRDHPSLWSEEEYSYYQ